MNALLCHSGSRCAWLLAFGFLWLMTGCAGRSADYQGSITSFQFGNVNFSLPAGYLLHSKRITIQGIQVGEIAIADRKKGSDIDDELLLYVIGIAKLQALKSDKGFNNDFQDVSKEFGVPARRVLSTVLDGDKEEIFSFHIVQERDVYLTFFKAGVDLDIDKVHDSAKLIHSLYRPERGEGTKDFALQHGCFQGLLASSIPFKYQATYRMPSLTDSIVIDYGGNLKHPPVSSAGTKALATVLKINPAAFLILGDPERAQDYTIDGLKGYEYVIEDYGMLSSKKPIFEWWSTVPSPVGDNELTLKIVSSSASSEMYDKNLEVWDHLLKNLKVER